jgi:hypothetical protein
VSASLALLNFNLSFLFQQPASALIASTATSQGSQAKATVSFAARTSVETRTFYSTCNTIRPTSSRNRVSVSLASNTPTPIGARRV